MAAAGLNGLQALTSSVIDVEALDEQSTHSTTSDSVSGPGSRVDLVSTTQSTTSDSVSGPGSHMEPMSTSQCTSSDSGSRVDLVSTLDSTASDSGSSIEPVTAVIGRYLQRATTAPPTIRHFFKPKPAGNDVTANNSESEPERNDLVAGDGISEIENDDDNNDDVIVTASADEQLATTTKAKSLQRESIIPRTLSKSAPSNRKRGNSSTVPAAKKHKQSSIAALFSARNPQKQPRVMQCPICSRNFDETISNAEVNLHIDGCLIE